MKSLKKFNSIDSVLWHSPYNLNLNEDNLENGICIWNGDNCKSLEIYSGWNFVRFQGGEILKGISTISNIENLKIYGFKRDSSYKEITNCWDELYKMNNLKYLDLRRDGLINDDLQFIASINTLEVLDLSSNALTSLIGISNLENLKSLNLSNNQISALWPLENLAHLGEIYDKDTNGHDVYGSLNLENNPLSDVRGTYMGSDGTQHEYYNIQILANLNINKNGKLQYLYLSGCSNITENGLKVLQAADLLWKGKSGF